jgi:signal transduction histidine kinase
LTSVLVLDDREADRSLLTTVLGYAGFQVREASEGAKALELALEEPPDLIISDILMPGMNGYEFVRRLREEPPIADTLVIFATANYVEGEVKTLADACGVTHFLEKPCDPQRVVSIVSDALGADGDEASPKLERREFDREQLNVLNDKLVEKVGELEEVSSARQALIVQLLGAQEEERKRIATAIHDDPIQTVSAVAMRLDTLASKLPPELHEAFQQLRTDVTQAVEDLRELVFELEPVALRTQGLRVALEAHLEELGREGLEFKLEMGEAEPDEATQTLLYRMAREALANVRTHAQADRVEVRIEESRGNWLVRVDDDGRGFDPSTAFEVRPGHLGLASMRERLETAGGSLAVDSAPGSGSTLTIKVPALEAPDG